MTRRHRKNLPFSWLMTDERVGGDALLEAVGRLPRGQAGIIFRHHRTPRAERRMLFDQLARIARRRRLMILVAGPERLAIAWKADGWHGPTWGRGNRALIHSMAAHDARELAAAQRCGADLIFLSPLFATRSHPGAQALGRARFGALARLSSVPVMALGGVNAGHRRMLKTLGASGWGAIDGWVRRGRGIS